MPLTHSPWCGDEEETDIKLLRYLAAMYSKQEIAKQKQAFWTAFGRYMQPINPVGSEKVNWINYKTGIRGISFRMDADNKEASIAIVLSHPDPATRQRYYAQLLAARNMLHEATGEAWEWQPEVRDEHGISYSSAGTRIIGVNVLDTADWPALISFFKPRIIALDEFWSNVKFAFESI